MERHKRHARNPNFISHPDRDRHRRRIERDLPKLCSEPSSIDLSHLGELAQESAAIIVSTKPHFIFCFDIPTITMIQTNVPVLWGEEPAPDILDLSSSDLPTKGTVSERLALALAQTLIDPGERRRAFIVPSENGAKSASALHFFLRGTFPWMDVYTYETDAPQER